jgi:UDP-N-acetylmuramate-alanine ligase
VDKISIPKVIYLKRAKVMPFIKDNFPQNGVLMIMGAGDIYDLAHLFHKKTG